jgi:hypothetical protein
VKITNLRCRDEGEKIKLTWAWQPEMEFVYVNGKLFTLWEYKKNAGCSLRKVPGVTKYVVCPFKRENGEDILYDESEITVSFKTKINFSICEKFSSRYRNFEITFTPQHDVPENVICYTINGNTYIFGETLKAETPTTRIIRAGKSENLRVFIRDEYEPLYDLLGNV